METALPDALGLTPEPSAITDEELRLASEIERAAYRNPSWTDRR